MFFIKIKVKGYLKNITENDVLAIDTIGIKNKNTITYLQDDIKYKLIVNNKAITLIRESKEFTHEMVFEEKKCHQTIYKISESTIEIELNVLPTKIVNNSNLIKINYEIVETNNKYEYLIEMSDSL